MRKLWKFTISSYNDHEGIFIATDEEIEKIVDRWIDFGELEGKHSYVSEYVDENSLTCISEDADFIDKFEKTVGISFGLDPFDHVEDDDECE